MKIKKPFSRLFEAVVGEVKVVDEKNGREWIVPAKAVIEMPKVFEAGDSPEAYLDRVARAPVTP